MTLTEQHQQLSHADETQQILSHEVDKLTQAEEPNGSIETVRQRVHRD